jgi:hypothetical protein
VSPGLTAPAPVLVALAARPFALPPAAVTPATTAVHLTNLH